MNLNNFNPLNISKLFIWLRKNSSVVPEHAYYDKIII